MSFDLTKNYVSRGYIYQFIELISYYLKYVFQKGSSSFILVEVMCKFTNSKHDIRPTDISYNVNKKKVWEKSIQFSDKNSSSTNLLWQKIDVNNAKDESRKKITFFNIFCLINILKGSFTLRFSLTIKKSNFSHL